METERARECFGRLDSCRGADASDRIDRSGLALVLAWIPYQDERLHSGKRESGEKTPTVQARRMNLFASDFLEQPGARKIPVIIDGGQRNPQNLRYLLIAHPGE